MPDPLGARPDPLYGNQAARGHGGDAIMDILIEIDERGGVRFSACPEDILEIARGLNPRDESLRLRAARLIGTTRGVRSQHGPDGEDDEH